MAKTDALYLQHLVRDDNNQIVQIGSEFVTQDVTGTPQTSPLTVSSATITIVVPDRAVEFIVNPTLADMRISDQSDMTPYDVIGNATKESIPCARMQNIYLLRDASTNVTLNFRFTLI